MAGRLIFQAYAGALCILHSQICTKDGASLKVHTQKEESTHRMIRFSVEFLFTAPGLRKGVKKASEMTNGVFSWANLTAPVLFRLVHQHQPTLLLDEVDSQSVTRRVVADQKNKKSRHSAA